MGTSASNPTKKAICNPDGQGSGSQSGQKDAGACSGQTVKFAHRTSNRSYISLSCDYIELSNDLSNVYRYCRIHILPTPDNQPMDKPVEAPSVAVKAEEQCVSNFLFTGGSNSETRAHFMNKMIDFAVTHPQMAGSKGFSVCAMPACLGKLMMDERGNDIHPCDCLFKICRNCYLDALEDNRNCPGCKEPYHPLHPHSGLPN
ncbi:hypothetical protein IEQ34_022766 [Dendrobium chrysotoxum]|uniref:Uncharacterized protein n=1 Tax=Dendrobium chrysotoxum TaxID=161865 RepID=A0AAV7FY20_DENCH|nr:hypothetical protein IEQ34_022766 [Dendrobium chrysotoxum]